MRSFELDLFLDEFKKTLTVPNDFLKIDVTNDIIKIKGTGDGILYINCSNENVTYEGECNIILDNNQYRYDYTLVLESFGFPLWIAGICKYFDVFAEISIRPNNIYEMTINHNKNKTPLTFRSNVDNYFVNLDVYMTDINLRRSNILGNKEKIFWAFSSLFYLENCELDYKINPYPIVIVNQIITSKLLEQIKEVVKSSNMIYLESLTFENCEINKDVKEEIEMLFPRVKIIFN